MKRLNYASLMAVTLLGAGLMTVSVRAQNGTTDCEDRITSGGWIVTEFGTANFGASGGLHKGEFWGHLNYVDKEDAGIHVRAQEVTDYCKCPGRDECRRITYFPASVTGVEGDTVVYVEVCDTGEPGVADTFGICIPAIDYCREGVLGGDDKPSGGNIELHKQTGNCENRIPNCEGPPIGCECFQQCGENGG